MTQVRTGIPRLVNGNWIGASDFREYAVVPSVVPAGLTFHGTPGTPHGIIDESGAGEGNVFQEQSVNSGQLEVDAFFGLQSFGEWLVRGYAESAAGSGQRVRFAFGPYQMDIPPALDAIDYFLVQSFSNSIRFSGQTIAGAGQGTGVTSEVNEGDPPGGFAAFYFWMRFRLTDAGSGFSRYQIHFTFSDFDTPPAVPTVWDIDDVSSQAVEQIAASVARMGWVRTTIGPTQISDRRISYLSFSNDLTFTEPPPLPEEVLDADTVIIPPTVIVDPIQDTWVGVTGSPFQTF